MTIDKTEEKNEQMSLFDHLIDLRKRLLRAVIAIVITTTISFSITQYLIQFLTIPVGGFENLQSIEITENIGVFMRVALLSGFILSFPLVFFQFWAFIKPGLKKTERRWVYFMTPFATFLFLSGASFAYFVMIPVAVPFLINFMGIPTTPRLLNYIEFVTSLIFWIGLAFEAPLLVFVLAKAGIVNSGMLIKQWRIAIVVIAIISAVITPTADPLNMGILMLPLFALYLISILMAKFA
ncbi:MAG: twin-arginine translocase subunit TatC [Anaerolineaceae bacterium]|nr:twin-arginine translocase subunit TatC [Anaerolineaceae bacterium]